MEQTLIFNVEEIKRLKSKEERTEMIKALCRKLNEGDTVTVGDKTFSDKSLDEFICEVDNLFNKAGEPLFDLEEVHNEFIKELGAILHGRVDAVGKSGIVEKTKENNIWKR